MKFESEWLQSLLEKPPQSDELADRLTRCGLLVELREAGDRSEIWDVEVTTNRPDAMNYRGLAREASVAAGCRVRPFEIDLVETDEEANELASVAIAEPEICSRFAARVVRGVTHVPSPEWIQRRLANSGVRPINAVVDVTNYVLLELGQPLHAYDLATVRGRQLVARRAERGERLTTLDGVQRELDPEVAVIADGQGVVGLAGIMGGADTEIGPRTRDVLLEAAHFDALTTRRAARKLGMHTEASHRFERGADPELPPVAVDLAAAMIAELTGAHVCRGRIDVCARPWQPAEMTMSISDLSVFAGLEISPDQVIEILTGLGFAPQRHEDSVRVTVPSHRVDIERVPDLYEEVIRHVGYDAVPSTLPRLATTPGRRHPNWELVDRGRGSAVSAGLTEIVTWSFVDRELDYEVESQPICPGSPLALENPLAQTQAVMRRSLLPGMLSAAVSNINQGEHDLALFEQGRVFTIHEDRPAETDRLGVLLSRDAAGRNEMFAHLKGVVEHVRSRVGLPDLTWRRGGAPWLDTEAGAELVTAGGDVLGFAGMLSREISDRWGLKVPIMVAELTLDLASEPKLPRFEPLPRFPAVLVDMTVEHDARLGFAELESAICELAGSWAGRPRLVARFTGHGLRPGAVRTTLRLTYRHPERSLTQEEVNVEQQRLRDELARRLEITFA